MATPLTEEAYEPIRAALFDGPPGQGATAAKQRIADGIAANPWPFVFWLSDAGIVDHVMFRSQDRTVTISGKDAPPFCSVEAHKETS